MVAALYSNPNWDDNANDRPGRIKEINQHYNKVIELIYDPTLDDSDEPDWENPFWQAHLRALQRTREKWGLDHPERTMREVIDTDEKESRMLQALEQRAKRREGLDQPLNGR